MNKHLFGVLALALSASVFAGAAKPHVARSKPVLVAPVICPTNCSSADCHYGQCGRSGVTPRKPDTQRAFV